jgi:cellulose synthase operon protein C
VSLSDAPKTPPAHRRAMAANDAQQPARPEISRDVPSVELRLAIAKDGLGLELARPARLGCVEVTELSVRLPGARFPIDVSGGVARFRHKRGALERVVLEVFGPALAAWAAPQLRGLLGPGSPRVWVSLRGAAATVCVSDVGDVLDADARPRIVAFDLSLSARGDEIRVVVGNARGVGLPSPATALAIGAVDAVLGGLADRRGAMFVLSRVGARVGKALLPDAGARAPDAAGLVVTALAAHDGTWIVQAHKGGASPGETPEATRALEAAAIAHDADEARLAGQLERARALDLAALERAPRHPDICRRIAEIDAHVGGRAEAALLTLREAARDPDAARSSSVLAGELSVEAGDVRGAIAALAHAGEAEAAPLLAAYAYARAAELAPDPLDALIWLDLGLARAGDAPALRWARVARRLASGRLEDALGDVEHLEALAHGSRDRYAVWRRAGDAWRRAGAAVDALPLYERALRYLPDDPAALAGLGAALVAGGRAARGAALLARAIDLADAARQPVDAMLLELARALAEALEDRPAAVARARAIPQSAPEALVARGLEGRWRAALGDLAGASLAFARLRELAGSLDALSPATAGALPLLVEAATFEDVVQGDLLAAQRHLACALRLRPKDAAIEDAYRALGRRIVGRPAELPVPAAPEGAAPHAPPAEAAAAVVTLDPADDEQRVEALTRSLQANPEDDAVVDELALRLSRLGRSLELFALLSARLEDAPPERRERLVPKQREVLTRLAADARHEGRAGEAELFEMALAALA